MRISCSAPIDMWDEFCTTAVYLSNLTFTSMNSEHNGKSPYQLWHSREPPLLHLHEIGCQAYALTLTHNPKLFQRSVPCILIGYAPNSKAYRLWDPVTDRVFNSFHVSFIETHQLPPPPSSIPSNSIPPTLMPSSASIPYFTPLPPSPSPSISFPISVPCSNAIPPLFTSSSTIPLHINSIPL